jgi:hypothetical protein
MNTKTRMRVQVKLKRMSISDFSTFLIVFSIAKCCKKVALERQVHGVDAMETTSMT